jgi:TIR domain
MSRPSDMGGGAFDPRVFQHDAFDVGRHVFLSHTSADHADAERIGIYLALEHIGVWYDEWEIGAGDSIVRGVDHGLGGCTHLLLLWSEAASRSDWVAKEWAATLAGSIQRGSPKVIPVRLDDASLPPILQDIKYIRVSGDHEEDHRTIIEAVTGRQPDLAFRRALVDMFNEVVHPYGNAEWVCCPMCGSERLKTWGVHDEEHGEGEGSTK